MTTPGADAYLDTHFDPNVVVAATGDDALAYLARHAPHVDLAAVAVLRLAVRHGVEVLVLEIDRAWASCFACVPSGRTLPAEVALAMQLAVNRGCFEPTERVVTPAGAKAVRIGTVWELTTTIIVA